MALKKAVAVAMLGVDITEIYSPERVAKVAAKFGLRAGSSFDLTNGWDFNIAEHRRKAWSKIKDESPYMLIGSPPCTYFSMLQELNVAVHGHKPDWKAKFDEEVREAKIHVEFCCTLLSGTVDKRETFPARAPVVREIVGTPMCPGNNQSPHS